MRPAPLTFILAVAVAAVCGPWLPGCGDGGGHPDGGPDGGECPDPGGVASWTVIPQTLSATGLYQDISSQTLASGVRAFHPTYELWSDGAQKQRWVKLPPCSTIDTADMDHWSMPVGTRLWKEFVVNGVRVETRLIARTGAGTAAPGDFLFAAYQWDATGTEARFVPDGVTDANGTPHDIPGTGQCVTCHGHLPEHVLGFSALQLSHGGSSTGIRDLDLATLASEGLLTAAPAAGGYSAPGDAVTSRALGYLHANCGNCHNPDGVYFSTPFSLRLEVGQTTPESTSAYQTAVGVAVEQYFRPGITARVAPGNPDASCVSARISRRGQGEQMPPIATEVVDDAGVEIVNAWIRSLPP